MGRTISNTWSDMQHVATLQDVALAVLVRRPGGQNWRLLHSLQGCCPTLQSDRVSLIPFAGVKGLELLSEKQCLSDLSGWQCRMLRSGYLSGRLLLFCELLGGVLSLPELLRPLRLLRKKGRQPELGSGSGGRSSRRSGLGVLFCPKMLSSWKQCLLFQFINFLSTYFEHFLLNDFLLPRDGDGSTVEL